MKKRYALYFAWLLALIASLTSLYFSDIKNLEPCHLCWYQRICLFPLVIILGIATFKGYNKIAIYTLPLTIIGFFFALFQIAMQEIPGFEPISICGAGPSCTEKVDIGLGPVTIPMLSAGGFLLLCILLGWVWGNSRKES